MGNCNKEGFSEATIDNKIFESIKSGVYKRVVSILNFYKLTKGIEALDSIHSKYNQITTTALGLCLIIGNQKLFKLLLENSCSVENMEKAFQISQFYSIEYLCRKGHCDLLQVYFPLYMKKIYPQKEHNSIRYSIMSSMSSSFTSKVLPLHVACREGKLEIIKYLFEYFKDSQIPKEFDIETLEETTGENCALVACREGYFDIVKYLHEKCEANFKLINLFKENAIIVTIAGMNKNLNYTFVDILNYLVEVVGVDITYMYEEALVLGKCKSVHNFLVPRLKKLGIKVNSQDLEDVSFEYTNKIVSDLPRTQEKILTESFVNMTIPLDMSSLPSSIHSSLLASDIKDSILF